MSDAPGTIWLQWHNNPEVTWEHEKIHNDDIEYVHGEVYEALLKESKSLRAELAQKQADLEKFNGWAEVQSLRARVEELEREREACIRQCPAPTIAQAAAMTHGEKLHVNTPKQIDMMWKRRSFYIEPELDAIDDCLDALGIERCEECEGSGSLWAPWDEQVPIKCPACNGKRYTVEVKR